MSVLSLSNVVKKYDGFSLDNISFELDKGSIMGLIGPNGSGKTTIIKLIMGLIFADSGLIKVFDRELHSNEIFIKQRIGYVADENILPEYITPKIAEKMMKGFFREWDSSLYKKLLEKYELPIGKRIKDLSKGMKVKLMIALTLSHRPDFVIMDESTSGLDPLARKEILDDVVLFSRRQGVSFLFSSHISSDIESIADFITILKGGKMELSCSKSKFIKTYQASGKHLSFDDAIINILKESEG